MSSKDDPKGKRPAPSEKRRAPSLSPEARKRISRVPRPVRKPVPGVAKPKAKPVGEPAPESGSPEQRERTRKSTNRGVGTQDAAVASSPPAKSPRARKLTRRGAPVTLPRPQRSPSRSTPQTKPAAASLPADLVEDSLSDDLEIDINLDSLQTQDPDLVAKTVVDANPPGALAGVAAAKAKSAEEEAPSEASSDTMSPFDEDPAAASEDGALNADDLAAIFARPTAAPIPEEPSVKAAEPAAIRHPSSSGGGGKKAFLLLAGVAVAAMGAAFMGGLIEQPPEGTPPVEVAPAEESEPETPTPAVEEEAHGEPAAEIEEVVEPTAEDTAAEIEEVAEPNSVDEPLAPSRPALAANRPSADRDTTAGRRAPDMRAGSRPLGATASSRFNPPTERAAPVVMQPSPPPTMTPAASSGLSRAQVRAGMQAVQGNVRTCGNGQGGRATVSVRISPTGRVAHARVTGYFASRPEGSCIARAVRAAQFPPFQGDHMTISYQFSL